MVEGPTCFTDISLLQISVLHSISKQANKQAKENIITLSGQLFQVFFMFRTMHADMYFMHKQFC